jgi:uncharacterized protein DUF4386
VDSAVFLLGPVLNQPDYTLSSGADTGVMYGCFLDLLNAFACAGTAVALFPVVKRQKEAVALGFVTSRMLEAAIIVPAPQPGLGLADYDLRRVRWPFRAVGGRVRQLTGDRGFTSCRTQPFPSGSLNRAKEPYARLPGFGPGISYAGDKW